MDFHQPPPASLIPNSLVLGYSSVLLSWVLISRIFLGSVVSRTQTKPSTTTLPKSIVQQGHPQFSVFSTELPGYHGNILEQPLTSSLGILLSSSLLVFYFSSYILFSPAIGLAPSFPRYSESSSPNDFLLPTFFLDQHFGGSTPG